MNSIIIRFYIVKENTFIDVKLDRRLSLIENFDLLKELAKINIKEFRIYDSENKAFIKLDCPIKNYHFHYFKKLHIL